MSTVTDIVQFAPSARDTATARESARILSRHHAQTKAPLKLQITGSKQTEPIELPAGAVPLLKDILEKMAVGHGIAIIPEGAELTTAQAANILNVSRPFLVKLIDENKIPHRKVGTHRRILIEDLIKYMHEIERRETILDQIVAESQKMGLYEVD
ncbi:MAG: helix-turn-helix domain-containing protein [Pseudohongiellaceae bacterium]